MKKQTKQKRKTNVKQTHLTSLQITQFSSTFNEYELQITQFSSMFNEYEIQHFGYEVLLYKFLSILLRISSEFR